MLAAEKSITETRKKMNDAGIEVSLFINADERQIAASARTGCQFIEFHTGQFAEDFHDPIKGPAALERLVAGAKQAHELGLKVNAGHGLNYENLKTLFFVPHLIELNIGHSLVSRAVFDGLDRAVREMLALMQGYR
jgi:pyridoxine 5-phosphate synthase